MPAPEVFPPPFLEFLLWPFVKLGRMFASGGKMRNAAANWLELDDGPLGWTLSGARA